MSLAGTIGVQEPTHLSKYDILHCKLLGRLELLEYLLGVASREAENNTQGAVLWRALLAEQRHGVKVKLEEFK